MPEKEKVIVPPDVARISEGLRDTGYEFNTAVADVIDNSIAAGASQVDVRIIADYDGNIILSVGDNGCGMDRDGLINAMKYGSRKRDDPSSLGKFGLGLKTASTAFCRRLTVVSRSAAQANVLRAVWDLDVMGDTNSWELELAPAVPHERQLLEESAKGSAGTVVIWEKVDRLLSDTRKPDSKAFKNAMGRLEVQLADHIATVYQRFLDESDSRCRNITILLNGKRVLAWDPFCLSETKKAEAEAVVPVELYDGRKAEFSIKAFILPRKEEINSDANRQKARISNELQGVYVYRENRLIHGPDWLGMYKKEPHFSLLRIELSFDHRLDDAFQVDIKKSRILLNEKLYEWIRDGFLAAPRREAETRYRKGRAGVMTGVAALLHTASGNAIQQKSSALKTATVTEVNDGSGEVEVENNSGTATAKIKIINNNEPNTVRIATSSNLDNAVLWEPALVNGAAGVTLNTGHPYYPKAYLPNKDDSIMIQALDFLLWSLAQAELNNINAENKDAFEEFRIEVSRNLKKLVADLPDPPDIGEN